MPSAKARAAKAATAARIAAYNAAAAAIESANVASVGAAGKPSVTIPGLLPCEANSVGANATLGVVRCLPIMPLKPTLPSMLNLNTSPNLNRALPVGAVIVNPGQPTHNASDEENIQPAVAGKAPSLPMSAATSPKIEEKVVDVGGHTSRPLSPIFGNRDNEKDVRAYEIERQRVKKGAELAKRKAKKANVAFSVVGSGGHGQGRGWSESGAGDWGKKEKVTAMDVDIEEMLLAGRKTASSARVSTSERPVNRKDQTRVESSGGGRVVSLSELVVLTQKKSRKVKGLPAPFALRIIVTDLMSKIEDDFEMIPPIRSVIVLDDALDAQDVDMDEPWEHVEPDFEAVKKRNHNEASYAAILAGAMH